MRVSEHPEFGERVAGLIAALVGGLVLLGASVVIRDWVETDTAEKLRYLREMDEMDRRSREREIADEARRRHHPDPRSPLFQRKGEGP